MWSLYNFQSFATSKRVNFISVDYIVYLFLWAQAYLNIVQAYRYIDMVALKSL